MNADALLSRLEGVRRTSRGWLARCPAHADKNPSLSVKEGERGVLLRCWSGCDLAEVCQAMGLRISDLFDDAPIPRGTHPSQKPKSPDRVASAYQFELGALDRRLRADRILEAAKKLDAVTMSDAQLDRALSFVAQAYADIEQAEMFEQVADDLRERDVTERISREQRRRAG